MSKPSHDRLAIVFILGVTLLLLAVALSFSFSKGRLQYEMDYEDIITHIDGLKRCRNLLDGGPLKLISGYIASPPHCPLHSFTAAVAFLIFGVHDWAPYVLNAVFLFSFLLLVWYQTKRFGALASSVAVLGAALCPVSFQTIHQFRPDFPCALATLWGMSLYPRRTGRGFEWWAAVSGVFFGLALLAKPPFFPYTLAMGGLPWFASIVVSARKNPDWLSAGWTAVWRSWPFFLATAIVAGPHYLVAWKNILEYIQLNQFGENAHVWRMTGGLGFQIAYHIFGFSGSFMLGGAVWILFALVIIGLIMASVQARQFTSSVSAFIYLVAITLWTWFFIAWNPHMNPFFGLTFQYALVLCGTFVLGWMTAAILESKRKVMLLAPTLCLVTLARLDVPFPVHDAKFTNADPALHKFAKDLPQSVFGCLAKWRSHSDSGYTLLSTYGIVSSHRLQWLADKKRMDFQFYGVPFWPIDKVVELFDQETKMHDRIDFAVISEPGAEGVFEELPNAETTGSLLKWLESRKEYRAVETIHTPSGKKYVLYMAVPNFGLFENQSGLGPKTGPVNLAGKPMVKNSVTAEILMDYISPATGQGLLEFSFHASDPIASIQILVNSSVVGNIDVSKLDPQSDFSTLEFKVPLINGKNPVTIRLLDASGKLVHLPKLIVRRLRISAPGDSSPFDDFMRKTQTNK